MKKLYKDYCGTYSVTEHRDGTATLRCRNCVTHTLDFIKTYKTVKGAKIALAKYCGGMPDEVTK